MANDITEFLQERSEDVTAILKDVLGERSDDKARALLQNAFEAGFKKATGFDWDKVNDPEEALAAIYEVAVQDEDLRKRMAEAVGVDDSLLDFLLRLIKTAA